jgi:hypothetical protein
MIRIEKKHVKRMACPKCTRAKLRLEQSADAAPSKLRCDVCKIDFLESDAAIQASLNEVLAEMTPAPVAAAHR